MTTSTSIKEFNKALFDKQAQLKALLTKGDVNEPMSDDDTKDADDLESQIASLKARIARISAALSDEADNAADPSDTDDEEVQRASGKVYKPSGVLIKTARDPNEAKGTRFARFVIGAGLANKMGQSTGVNYVKNNLNDPEVAKALNTTTAVTGGALIPQDFRNEIIDLLYAKCVVRGAGTPVWPMPMGNLTVPKTDGGATAYWQNELDDMTVSQESFTDIQLTAHKLTALVPVTNDMIRRSPLSVEAIVRQDMIKQIALAEDLAYLTGDGTNKNPIGMLNIAGTTAVAGGAATLVGANNTLRAMELGLMSKNVDLGNAQWFFSPYVVQFLNTLTDQVGNYFFAPELATGKLLGHKVNMSNQLASNLGSGTNQSSIILANVDDLIIADTLAMFADSSAEASYVTGGVTYSAYTRDQTLFRVIQEVDFNTRHAASIAISTVTSWTPGTAAGVAGAPYYADAVTSQATSVTST